MSKRSHGKKSKKYHLTKKKIRRVAKKNVIKHRKTLKQKGGGVLFELVPSDIKQIGYFFENGVKTLYKSILGMP